MARGSHSSGRSSRRRGSDRRATRYVDITSRSARRPRRRRRLPRFGSDPGDRLIALGVLLFFGGLVAIGLTFVPFVALHRSNTDLAVNLGTFATVVGLALGVFGAYRQARSLHR